MNTQQIWTPDQRLLALSWKQPYAELMLHGKIETRIWNTHYRGWVLICVNKQSYSRNSLLDIAGKRKYSKIFETLPGWPKYNCGKAIAIGRLVDCRPMRPDDEAKCFVMYNPELYCHIYKDVTPIEPFDWKGSQGWKEVSRDIKEQIKLLDPEQMPRTFKEGQKVNVGDAKMYVITLLPDEWYICSPADTCDDPVQSDKVQFYGKGLFKIHGSAIKF